MLKRIIINLWPVLFLTACQTHFPIVSDDINAQPCSNQTETIELADIDYLLYANRMVDNMIKSHLASNKHPGRIKLFIEPLASSIDTGINLQTLNLSIKNRIIRSGQFIIEQNKKRAKVQISGSITIVNDTEKSCQQDYEQFSLQLTRLDDNKIIWFETKYFN